MKAYKVFNPDFTCRDFQYEVGKTYELRNSAGVLEEPSLCEKGFHACAKVSDCFNYYSFDPSNKVALVELSGTVLGIDTDKQCSNIITVVEEVSWNDMLNLANTGIGNSGYCNSGNRNSGDRNSGNMNSGNMNSGNMNSGCWNSGYWNSGDSNSGNSNSGYWNSGNRNSGNSNSGNSNSGNWNSGDSNSGDSNSGNRNSGNRNSGYWNSGYWNSGYWNSGDRNSGDRNSGNWNSGNRNSGNWNSGNSNSGYWNSGNRNSGYWNSCDKETGNFNSKQSDVIRVFNKECKRSAVDNASLPNFCYDVNPCLWISFESMSDEEKIENKDAFVAGGYLKTISYKEAWAESFKKATPSDIALLKKYPNFDAEVFEEITGIKIV